MNIPNFFVSLTVHLSITFVKTNLTHNIFVLQYVYYVYDLPLHVSGISHAHHQELN
jgi:hypothetical protein